LWGWDGIPSHSGPQNRTSKHDDDMKCMTTELDWADLYVFDLVRQTMKPETTDLGL